MNQRQGVIPYNGATTQIGRVASLDGWKAYAIFLFVNTWLILKELRSIHAGLGKAGRKDLAIQVVRYVDSDTLRLLKEEFGQDTVSLQVKIEIAAANLVCGEMDKELEALKFIFSVFENSLSDKLNGLRGMRVYAKERELIAVERGEVLSGIRSEAQA